MGHPKTNIYYMLQPKMAQIYVNADLGKSKANLVKLPKIN